MSLHVFDLDHTLLTANSSFRFGTYLYQRKFFSFTKLLFCLSLYARHKWCGMSVQTLHAKAFNTLFKGYKLSTIQEYADLFLSQYLSSMLYHPVVQRLKDAQAKREYTLILSSSPAFLVEAIAQRLQVAHWKATTYHLDSQGHLTAIAHVLEGQDKADYVTTLAHQMNLPSSAITAYSDSYLDLPVLKIAGRAIGVVPDPYLKRICLHQGWEIL